MNFRDKIIEILKGMTGDAEKDKAYLEAQIEAYKDDEDAEPIERALSYKLTHPERYTRDYSDEASQEYYISRESVDIYIDEATYQLLQKHDGITAENMLAALIEEIGEKDTEDDKYDRKCFNSVLENAIYNVLEDPKKEIVSNIYDYPKIYYIYGYLLIENNKLDEAEAALLKANKWNPLNTDIIYELTEIYKKEKRYDEFIKWTRTGLKYAITPQALARGYRNTGFYYIEKQNFQLAADLFIFSLMFEDTESANNELAYIQSKTGQTPERSDMKDFIAALKKENIQFGPDEHIMSIMYDMASIYEKEGLLSESVSLLSMIYDLTYDKELPAKIDELKSKMN